MSKQRKLPTVAEDYADFSAMIFAGIPGISDTQRTETRRAFYAGAWSMLCTVRALGEPDVPEAEGVEYLEARKAELEAFQALVKAGKA